MTQDNKKTTLPGVVSSRDVLLADLEKLYHAIILQQLNAKSKQSSGNQPTNQNGNQPANKKKNASKGRKIMARNNVVKSLNLKFYAEQLMHTFMTDQELAAYYRVVWSHYQKIMLSKNSSATAAQSQGHQYDYLFARFIDHIKTLPKEYQIAAIVHDSDEEADPNDFFLLSSIKSHCHLAMKRRDGKSFRVNKALEMLKVEFRRYIDNDLWAFGVATCGRFESCIAYLTHETPNAEAEGKFIYDRSLIFSNCDASEIDDLREGYLIANETRKLTQQQLADLDKLFYGSGYKIKDFEKIYGSLPFAARSNSKMKTAVESYYRGVRDRLREEPPEINRVCLFIQGPPNTGKTYACKKALEALGHNVYYVTGGGSGKFDSLTASHTAILIDDEICPNLLNMSDSRATLVYRRNRNNPVWLGILFVVTSNLTLDEWCEQSKLRVLNFDGSELTAHGKAMHSRFICCHVECLNGVNQIVPDKDAWHLRGTDEEQKEKVEIANRVLSEANKVMSTYQPHAQKDVIVDAALYGVGTATSTAQLCEQFKEFEQYWRDNFYNSYDAVHYFDRRDAYEKWLNYGMPSAEQLRKVYPQYNVGFRSWWEHQNPQGYFEEYAPSILSWCIQNNIFSQ